MQCPGVLRNSIWVFQGLIKKQMEIPISRKVCFLFFSFRISGVQHVFVTQFREFSGVRLCFVQMFCLEFPRAK